MSYNYKIDQYHEQGRDKFSIEDNVQLLLMALKTKQLYRVIPYNDFAVVLPTKYLFLTKRAMKDLVKEHLNENLSVLKVTNLYLDYFPSFTVVAHILGGKVVRGERIATRRKMSSYDIPCVYLRNRLVNVNSMEG